MYSSNDSGQFSAIVAVSRLRNPFKIGVLGSYIGGDANILFRNIKPPWEDFTIQTLTLNRVNITPKNV
jgi:hypothetical protein